MKSLLLFELQVSHTLKIFIRINERSNKLSLLANCYALFNHRGFSRSLDYFPLFFSQIQTKVYPTQLIERAKQLIYANAQLHFL